MLVGVSQFLRKTTEQKPIQTIPFAPLFLFTFYFHSITNIYNESNVGNLMCTQVSSVLAVGFSSADDDS